MSNETCKAALHIRRSAFQCQREAGHKGQHQHASEFIHALPKTNKYLFSWGEKDDEFQPEWEPQK